MCGLIFCAEPLKWKSIVSANLARAGRNKGVFTVTPVLSAHRNGSVTTGPTTSDPVWVVPSHPAIAHLQAPTSEFSLPHPAVAARVRAWHNGIIKPAGIEALQKEMFSHDMWDTMLIAQAIEYGLGSDAFQMLGAVEGSLAVIAIDDMVGMNTLYAFRNAIAPLYTDGKNLSSVPLGNIDRPLEAGVVYMLSEDRWLETRHSFPCTHNPFGLPL